MIVGYNDEKWFLFGVRDLVCLGWGLNIVMQLLYMKFKLFVMVLDGIFNE